MIINPIDSYKTNAGNWLRKIAFYYKRSLLKTNKNGSSNVYFATLHKCGSQWMKEVFSDARVRGITGLEVYPQHHYDINDFHMSFPSRSLVPGLYMDYPLYDVFIDKPKHYKTIFLYRDPRDLVVSWYWSSKETHGLNRGVRINRERLNQMSLDEGLLYAIAYLTPRFAELRSWYEMGGKDKHVKLIKFEELTAYPEDGLKDIFNFLGYEIDDSLINDIVSDYSKNRMREKDMKKTSDSKQSHYRKVGSSHEGMFKDFHYKKFYDVTGNLIDVLGYKK